MNNVKLSRIPGFVYALGCYAAVNAALVYMILFVNDLFIPGGVSAAPAANTATAVFIDLALVVLWGVQHSVMARRGFKEVLTRIIPKYAERATYCLASAAALAVVCYFWITVPGVAWAFEGEAVRWALAIGGGAGWVLLLAATFEIDHFELFGVRQAWAALFGRELKPHRFQARYIYAWVRHPIQTGILMGVWLAPTMSMSRLLFASLMTLYVLVGLYFEERDLVRQFGERYRRYMREVPRLFPVTVKTPRMPAANEVVSIEQPAEIVSRS